MWFKVDDKFHDRAGRGVETAAIGLWTLAGSWCAGAGTDGFVPASVAKRWAGRRTGRLAGVLVDRGLWEPASMGREEGWRFVGWSDSQPPTAVVRGPFQPEPVGHRLRQQILERDRYTCQRCGATNETELLEIDHVIPRIKGGSNDPANLQVLCQPCNARKGDREG